MKRVALILGLLVLLPAQAEPTLWERAGFVKPETPTEQVTEQVEPPRRYRRHYRRRHYRYRHHRRHHRSRAVSKQEDVPVVAPPDPAPSPAPEPERFMRPDDNPELYYALKFKKAKAALADKLIDQPPIREVEPPKPVVVVESHAKWVYVMVVFALSLGGGIWYFTRQSTGDVLRWDRSERT